MKKFIKYSFIMGLSIFIIIFSIAAVFLTSIFGSNANVSFNKNSLLALNTAVSLYDSENNPLSKVSSGNAVVKLNDLPSYVPQSFISIEDKNFYNHNGLNYKRIAKALYTNITTKEMKEGASTISQQLIKNTHLSSEKTLNRKIQEMYLAKRLENEFSKNEILETYLNVIYFGNSSYGIESASQNYFNKSAKNLSLSESALLAGLIKSPANYSPIYNITASKNRRDIVLNEMYKDKAITKQQLEKAKTENIKMPHNITSNKAKNIYERSAIAEASKILNISEKDLAVSGVKIYTYLDSDLQKEMVSIIENPEYYHKNSYGFAADSASIALNNKTGGITAFYGKSNYNLNTMIRQPGSAIKPILVYAPALEYGEISTETPLLDEKININGYKPNNVGNEFHGWVSTRESLEKSLNIPAVKIMKYTGIEKSKNFAKKAGITFDKKDTGYATALGGFTYGLNIKQLANTYQPLANGGKYVKASFIKEIKSTDGITLYKNNTTGRQIMSEETAYLTTDMLKTATKNGTSKKLNSLPFTVAGKTGTVGLKNSNNNSDAWSFAYTPERTIGVWLGNSTGNKEYQLEPHNNGGTYSTLIVRDILQRAHKNSDTKTFKKPNGVVSLKIDTTELKNNNKLVLANSSTPDIYTKTALFNKKYAPTKISTNFLNLQKPTLNVKVNNSKANLSFNVQKHLTYKVYKTEEDKTSVIKEVKNQSGNIQFIDDNLNESSLYEYYLEVIQTNYASGKVLTKKSDSIKIITNSKSDSFTSQNNKVNTKQTTTSKPKRKKKSFWFF